MSQSQRQAVALGIVPRAPRLPANIDMLLGIALNSFCPVASVERRVRADRIAVLIDQTLVEAGR